MVVYLDIGDWIIFLGVISTLIFGLACLADIVRDWVDSELRISERIQRYVRHQQ